MNLIPDKYRKSAQAIAFTIFLLGSIWSVSDIIRQGFSFNYIYLLSVLFLAAPVSLLLSVRRFQSLARVYGAEFSIKDSANIVVYGGIANLLPIPGALLVRLAAIKTKAGMKKSLLANFVGIVIWSASCLLILALATWMETRAEIAMYFALAGIVAILCSLLIVHYSCASKHYFFQLSLVQFLLTLTNTIRLWFICLAAGYLTSFVLPASVSLASILVSGASLSPGGVGVAELVSGGLAFHLNYPIAIGFIMMAGNRLVTWLWLALTVIYLRIDDKQKPKQGL